MRAYKFLARGGVAPISGLAWPLPDAGAPGAWLEASGPLSACGAGLHVCAPADLAHWLSDELWQVETAGEALAGIDCTVVRRARLVRRVGSWSEGGASRFLAASIAHAEEALGPGAAPELRGFLDDARLSAQARYFAVGAYCTALAVARHLAPSEPEAAYRKERLWQSTWLERELLQS